MDPCHMGTKYKNLIEARILDESYKITLSNDGDDTNSINSNHTHGDFNYDNVAIIQENDIDNNTTTVNDYILDLDTSLNQEQEQDQDQDVLQSYSHSNGYPSSSSKRIDLTSSEQPPPPPITLVQQSSSHQISDNLSSSSSHSSSLLSSTHEFEEKNVEKSDGHALRLAYEMGLSLSISNNNNNNNSISSSSGVYDSSSLLSEMEAAVKGIGQWRLAQEKKVEEELRRGREEEEEDEKEEGKGGDDGDDVHNEGEGKYCEEEYVFSSDNEAHDCDINNDNYSSNNNELSSSSSRLYVPPQIHTHSTIIPSRLQGLSSSSSSLFEKEGVGVNGGEFDFDGDDRLNALRMQFQVREFMRDGLLGGGGGGEREQEGGGDDYKKKKKKKNEKEMENGGFGGEDYILESECCSADNNEYCDDDDDDDDDDVKETRELMLKNKAKMKELEEEMIRMEREFQFFEDGMILNGGEDRQRNEEDDEEEEEDEEEKEKNLKDVLKRIEESENKRK